MVDPVNDALRRVGLLGYGEVGRILAEDLRAGGIAQVVAYDLKLGSAAEAPLREHAATHGVALAASHAELASRLPGIDWERQAAYFFQRVIEHGRRRAEEMREAARTVEEVGLTPWSAAGTAERQGWVAGLADAGAFGRSGEQAFARSADWRIEADRILDRVRPARKRG